MTPWLLSPAAAVVQAPRAGYTGTALTMTDMFCGAGGSSTGAIQVPGVQVAIAANHWQLAINVHNLNHPTTDHAAKDLHQEDPRFFPTTDLAWMSPECTKWSQGNSAQLPAIEEGLFEDPLSSEAAHRSRLLMFDCLKFIEYHRYRAVIIENVVDIATQSKYRLAWYEWRQQLRALGYKFRVVSLNSMHAQTYGAPAPQSRDRIYIVAWREGENAPDLDRILRPRAYCPKCDQIVRGTQSWKNGKTVGRYRQSYLYTHARCGTVVEPGWLPAAAAIDWSIPGERIGDRLKPKTRLRIAHGIARYWGPVHIEARGNQYDAADPNHPQHGNPNAYYRAWSTDDVLRTLHTDETKGLAVPVEGRDGKHALPLDLPMRTQTTRLETGLVQQPPFIAEMYGTSTARPVTQPAGTFTAGGNHHALVTGAELDALVHRHNTGGAEMTTPAFEELRTLTAAGHQSLLQQPRERVTPADLRAAEEMLPEVLFRMFRPHEVAAGMAFPSDYRWDVRDAKGKTPSNRDLTKMAGNAVTPPSSRDLVAAVAEAITGENHMPASAAMDLGMAA